MSSKDAALLLRLAGPLQSWGGPSEFNRRDTRPEPTKSGVLGLLAAAQGQARTDDLVDLLRLKLGIRVDQPGSLLRDFHTVSDYRGVPLLSAAVNAKGAQKLTSPAKRTHVTTRFYLQDAVFVAAIRGPRPLIDALHEAVRQPAFPLALGRRSCVPVGPIAIGVRDGEFDEIFRVVPWQASQHAREQYSRRFGKPAAVDLAFTVEDDRGNDTLTDVPRSFDPLNRGFTSRQIRHGWVSVPSGFAEPDDAKGHDPFALLGW